MYNMHARICTKTAFAGLCCKDMMYISNRIAAPNWLSPIWTSTFVADLWSLQPQTPAGTIHRRKLLTRFPKKRWAQLGPVGIKQSLPSMGLFKVNSWMVQLLWHFYFALVPYGLPPKVNLWCLGFLEDGDGGIFLFVEDYRIGYGLKERVWNLVDKTNSNFVWSQMRTIHWISPPKVFDWSNKVCWRKTPLGDKYGRGNGRNFHTF